MCAFVHAEEMLSGGSYAELLFRYCSKSVECLGSELGTEYRPLRRNTVGGGTQRSDLWSYKNRYRLGLRKYNYYLYYSK